MPPGLHHPAWQRILDRIRAREEAIPHTEANPVVELTKGVRNLQGRCRECGEDLPRSFATVAGKLGGLYQLCDACYETYQQQRGGDAA